MREGVRGDWRLNLCSMLGERSRDGSEKEGRLKT